MSLAIALVVYGFLASALPVWLLLAPRDYLSTFVKLGVIMMLAVGILFVRPELQLPASDLGFLASALPVWLLLAPRDYLSTFVKLGVIMMLAVGILFVRPELQLPAF